MGLTKSINHSIDRRRVLKAGVSAGAAIAVSNLALFSTIAKSQTVVNPTMATDDLPEKMVKALHSAFGEHHARAVHAKGIVLEGTFTPSAEARDISTATLFTETSIPVSVRFSDFTGIPDIPDTVDGANPRGFAVKFRAPGDASMDIVSHSFNGFPTKTSEEFGDLLRAIGASGEGAAKPTALDEFLGTHPIAATFLTTQKPAPVSYATVPYFGVNSFAFINAAKGKNHVRYRFVPKAGEHFLTPEEIASKGPNYLSDEITKRVGAAPIIFEWFAQIAEASDAIDDPSIAWPESRKLVKLGIITIEKMTADQVAATNELLFLPGHLPLGIEIADPMLAIRTAAYPISFAERQ